jgi:hypothetical protein
MSWQAFQSPVIIKTANLYLYFFKSLFLNKRTYLINDTASLEQPQWYEYDSNGHYSYVRLSRAFRMVDNVDYMSDDAGDEKQDWDDVVPIP